MHSAKNSGSPGFRRIRDLTEKLEIVAKEAKPMSILYSSYKTKDHTRQNISRILQSEDSSLSNRNFHEKNSKLLIRKQDSDFHFGDLKDNGSYHDEDTGEHEPLCIKNLQFFNNKRKSFLIQKEEDAKHTSSRREENKETIRNLRNKVKVVEESLCETDRYRDIVKQAKSNFKIASKKVTSKKKRKKKIGDKGRVDMSRSKFLKFDTKKLSRESNKRRKRKKSREKSKRNISGSKMRGRTRSRENSMVKTKTEKSLASDNKFQDFLNKLSRSKKRAKSGGIRHASGLRSSRVGFGHKVIGSQKFSIISHKKYP